VKVKAVLIGSGNIGTDLLEKALRSEWVEPAWMVGIDPESEGLARARRYGLKVTHQGIDGFLAAPGNDGVRIAFDATAASQHARHDEALAPLGIVMVDLTPAAIGDFCVPPVNLKARLGAGARNVNMVTCGGQATIPIVYAVSSVQPVKYAEIVATIASKSAGPGTRKNIDEFTRTTARGLEEVGGAIEGKAIIILNPAEPPLMMRDTVHCLTVEPPDEDAIVASVQAMMKTMQEFVPGYRLKNGPVFEGNRVSVFLEVEGLGDYLPKYAGNLDIMTSAALRTAEGIAQEMAR
jgi:acetaldehyde/propanal dehydrogenase